MTAAACSPTATRSACRRKPSPRRSPPPGYVTGHFGKWHLDGFKGPGVPVLADDPAQPRRRSVSMSGSPSRISSIKTRSSRRMGKIEEFTGDSSDIIVAEA